MGVGRKNCKINWSGFESLVFQWSVRGKMCVGDPLWISVSENLVDGKRSFECKKRERDFGHTSQGVRFLKESHKRYIDTEQTNTEEMNWHSRTSRPLDRISKNIKCHWSSTRSCIIEDLFVYVYIKTLYYLLICLIKVYVSAKDCVLYLLQDSDKHKNREFV